MPSVRWWRRSWRKREKEELPQMAVCLLEEELEEELGEMSATCPLEEELKEEGEGEITPRFAVSTRLDGGSQRVEW